MTIVEKMVMQTTTTAKKLISTRAIAQKKTCRMITVARRLAEMVDFKWDIHPSPLLLLRLLKLLLL